MAGNMWRALARRMRPLDPPGIFMAVVYTGWPGRGLSLHRDRGLLSDEVIFCQRDDNLQREKTKCTACSRVKEKQKRIKRFFFPFYPTPAVREYLQPFLDSNIIQPKH